MKYLSLPLCILNTKAISKGLQLFSNDFSDKVIFSNKNNSDSLSCFKSGQWQVGCFHPNSPLPDDVKFMFEEWERIFKRTLYVLHD